MEIKDARYKKEKKQLIFWCISFGIMIVLGSLQVLFSPYTFVRVLTLIGIIVQALSVGAFLRELFILEKKMK